MYSQMMFIYIILYTLQSGRQAGNPTTSPFFYKKKNDRHIHGVCVVMTKKKNERKEGIKQTYLSNVVHEEALSSLPVLKKVCHKVV